MKNRETVSVDRAGRVVIPKAIRDRLHLQPGTLLTLEVDAERLVLHPQASVTGCLGRQEGVLILTAELQGHLPTVEDVRISRSRRLMSEGPQ